MKQDANRCVWMLNNGMKCNWFFFRFLHEFGFIGR